MKPGELFSAFFEFLMRGSSKIRGAVVSSDYECRENPTPDPENRWNVFIHFRVRLINGTKVERTLFHMELEFPESGLKLQPQVYKNDGTAEEYFREKHLLHPIPPGGEETMRLNFIMPSPREVVDPIAGFLNLVFADGMHKRLAVKATRRLT